MRSKVEVDGGIDCAGRRMNMRDGSRSERTSTEGIFVLYTYAIVPVAGWWKWKRGLDRIVGFRALPDIFSAHKAGSQVD